MAKEELIRKKGRSRSKYQAREKIKMLLNESRKPNITTGPERAEAERMRGKRRKKRELIVVFPFVYNRSSGKLLFGHILRIYGLTFLVTVNKNINLKRMPDLNLKKESYLQNSGWQEKKSAIILLLFCNVIFLWRQTWGKNSDEKIKTQFIFSLACLKKLLKS